MPTFLLSDGVCRTVTFDSRTAGTFAKAEEFFTEAPERCKCNHPLAMETAFEPESKELKLVLIAIKILKLTKLEKICEILKDRSSAQSPKLI